MANEVTDLQEQPTGSIWRYFLETTTLHALPHVLDVPIKCLRVVWVFVFLFMSCALIAHAYTIIARYRSYPLQETVSIKTSQALEFPAVTVCNLNPIPRSRLEQDVDWRAIMSFEDRFPCYRLENLTQRYNGKNVSAMVASWFEASLRKCTVTKTFEAVTVRVPYGPSGAEGTDAAGNYEASGTAAEDEVYEYAWYEFFEEVLTKYDSLDDAQAEELLKRSQTPDHTDVTNLLRASPQRLLNLGFTKDELIAECSFDRGKCKTDMFSQLLNDKYGLCYVFNSGQGGKGLHKTRRYGSHYGLRLTIDIRARDYIGLFASEYGSKIEIHSPWTQPHPSINGFTAPPGIVTDVGIKKVSINRLPAPFQSMCEDADNYWAESTSTVGRYTQLGCKIRCINSYLMKKCGCGETTVVFEPFNYTNWRLIGTEDCSIFNKTQRSCRSQVYHKVYLPATDKDALECACSQPCHEVIYTRAISQGDWPSLEYSRLKLSTLYGISPLLDRVEVEFERGAYGNNTEDPAQQFYRYAKDNLVRLHIYFEELNYEMVQEAEAYPITNLMADTGGVLGLYLGLSFTTVVEIMQLIFLACYYKVKGKSVISTTENG